MKIKLFIEGFIIGIAKIMPGVSGALFACLFGVYDIIINTLSNPKNIIKNYKTIIPLGMGIITSIIYTSGLIKYLLEYHYTQSMLTFIGIMIYSLIPQIKKIQKNKILNKQIITYIIIILIIIPLFRMNLNICAQGSPNILKRSFELFLSGLLDAFATIVPGISGTALLMMIGYYNLIITSISTIYLKVLIPFTLGLIVGLIYISKIINYALIKYKNIIDLLILSFTLYSTFYLTINSISNISVKILIPIIIGFIISYIIDTKLNQ